MITQNEFLPGRGEVIEAASKLLNEGHPFVLVVVHSLGDGHVETGLLNGGCNLKQLIIAQSRIRETIREWGVANVLAHLTGMSAEEAMLLVSEREHEAEE